MREARQTPGGRLLRLVGYLAAAARFAFFDSRFSLMLFCGGVLLVLLPPLSLFAIGPLLQRLPSAARARNVAKYLTDEGIPAKEVHPRGMSDTNQKGSKSASRRVEIVVATR